jgi:hypothetical protein
MEREPMTTNYLYEVDKRFLPVLTLLGFRPKKDGVRIAEDGRLSATFGWLSVESTLANVEEAHVTSGYRWWTAIGPRMSFVDDGLTFGTNYRAGLCIHFKEKVRSVLSRKGHSALTVTVADLEGLERALGS